MTTLDVRFSPGAAGAAQYFYTLKKNDGSAYGPLAQEYPVEVNQDLIRSWCAEIDNALIESREDPDRLRETLRSRGVMLYKQLLHSREGNVPELVRALRGTSDPLVVQTNEDVVPWELLHDGEQFLGLSVDLGRRSVVNSHVTLGRDIGPIRRALIVGDTLGDLPKARDEVERISTWLREQGIECNVLLGAEATLPRVIGELAVEETPYDLFHFSGHASSVPEATGLLAHRRELINDLALRTLSGGGAPPVVFINGCASAASTMSVCTSFMLMGAKTVVGTRTAVDDESASQFAQAFYSRLQKRLPAGAALRKSREELAEAGDGSWAAFVLYGDPAARISAERRPRTRKAPPTNTFPLTSDATALMKRIGEKTAPRRLATSVDLLEGLLETKEIQERSLPRVGPQRMSLLLLLLETFQKDATTTSAGIAEQNGNHSGDVELSDTVSEVMTLANQTVATAGRRSISIDDLAAALLKVGSSTCVDVVELCGITMNDVLAPLPATDAADQGLSATGTTPATSSRSGTVIQLDGLDPRAVAVIQCARLLAAARNEPVSSYLVLKAFALVESQALRQSLEAQGPAGDQALRRIAALGRPRAEEFTRRVLTLLTDVADPGDPAARVDESALLRALLSDSTSSAVSRLSRLGIDAEQVIRALSE